MPVRRPQIEKVEVRLGGGRTYPVLIGEGVTEGLGSACVEAGLGRRVLLITNETVGELYADRMVKSLAQAGMTVRKTVIPDGEEHKTLATAAFLYDACVEAELDRSSFIAALGGGVVGDLAGFAAATYMRGIDFVQVPTTLLAQVDASVGGKTGVNHARGKNMIGAFHQPRLVLADPQILRTLPEREFSSGLAEVIKHGLIADRKLYAFCSEHLRALLDREPRAITHVVRRSVEIKGAIVEKDEREGGVRAILNFGHTVGHAIESATRFARYTHGEAVAIGMVVEGWISAALGMLSEDDVADMIEILSRIGLPVCAQVSAEDVIQAMYKDKKVREGRLRLALLDGIGRAAVVDDVAEDVVLAAYLRHQTGGAR